MKKIIDRILKAEEEAVLVVDAASKQAAEIVAYARKKAARFIEDERLVANREKEVILRNTSVLAQEKRDQAVVSARRKAKDMIADKANSVKTIAGKFFTKIIKT